MPYLLLACLLGLPDCEDGYYDCIQVSWDRYDACYDPCKACVDAWRIHHERTWWECQREVQECRTVNAERPRMLVAEGLSRCLSGPGVPHDAWCELYDVDGDGDVDLYDVAGLLRR